MEGMYFNGWQLACKGLHLYVYTLAFRTELNSVLCLFFDVVSLLIMLYLFYSIVFLYQLSFLLPLQNYMNKKMQTEQLPRMLDLPLQNQVETVDMISDLQRRTRVGLSSERTLLTLYPVMFSITLPHRLIGDWLGTRSEVELQHACRMPCGPSQNALIRKGGGSDFTSYELSCSPGTTQNIISSRRHPASCKHSHVVQGIHRLWLGTRHRGNTVTTAW